MTPSERERERKKKWSTWVMTLYFESKEEDVECGARRCRRKENTLFLFLHEENVVCEMFLNECFSRGRNCFTGHHLIQSNLDCHSFESHTHNNNMFARSIDADSLRWDHFSLALTRKFLLRHVLFNECKERTILFLREEIRTFLWRDEGRGKQRALDEPPVSSQSIASHRWLALLLLEEIE